MKLGVAIVGCGLIGIKRAETLDDMLLRVCVDVDPFKADALASRGRVAGAGSVTTHVSLALAVSRLPAASSIPEPAAPSVST